MMSIRWIAVTAALGLLACVASPAIKVGDKAPDFTAYTLEGKAVKLSSYKGKVVSLTFFASWCGGCNTEAPELVQLQDKYKGNKNVVMLAVAVSDKEDAVKQFQARHKTNYQIVLDKNNDKGINGYGFRYIPSSFVVGKDGKIAFAAEGGPENVLKTLSSEIDKALKAK